MGRFSMGLALAEDGRKVSDRLRHRRTCHVPRVAGMFWGSPHQQGAHAHPSALYWLVPGMPAPCWATVGLSVVAAFSAFMAFSFLL